MPSMAERAEALYKLAGVDATTDLTFEQWGTICDMTGEQFALVVGLLVKARMRGAEALSSEVLSRIGLN